mgnify:CR=1 FL=1|tara:strand:+ start:465 stop:764 length:300 start_codon:yes stop_codon:yes gene_type:complete
MPSRNKQLRMSNVDGYLSQINKNTSPDTSIKLKCRAAKCFANTGSIKYLKEAIELYTEAYDIQGDMRGYHHHRTLNIVNLMIQCENKIEVIKKNKNTNY